ncbi:glycosyltransferase family 4 protein [Anaeromyxobacter sp. Fw109-5]|uniref:glycosyltransferase family 4 protein n=1 Tax=Anaeromyxobacter sp. (strain Fw109-5) TaxID=404589 RepID=UPI0000ED8AD4|nr:glycosyltransferase family 4 protein [Anaeromyxobacter sp. Fw109-5]ABS27415.1 glycosyl transferase group 1 [Anaeromyxobacter sp. Fw109-5]
MSGHDEAPRGAARGPRVLLTADTVGGVFAYAAELCAALAQRGCAVALATQGRPLSADQRAELARVPGLEVHEGTGKLEWMQDPWDDVAREGERLLSIARRFRPDVVHLNGYAHGALPFGVPKVVVAHSCVLSWFEAVRHAPAPPSFDRYRLEVRRGLDGADAVVAPTRAMLRALERHHGKVRRGLVIANGRAPERYPPRPKEPFVLCAARLWDEAKGAATLDAAAGRLAWPVLLAGDEMSPDLAHPGASAPRHARPLGRLAPDALAVWYGRASIYALPARYEPFGLSALEAALAGCALVLGDVPSLREVWLGAAAFVPPGDVEALASTLAGIVHDAPARAELGRQARRRALLFGRERMAERYLATYGGLLARAEEGAVPCAS